MTDKMTLEEARELCVSAERRAIEDHYGKPIGLSFKDGGISPSDLITGLVWVWERRRALSQGQKLPTWREIEGSNDGTGNGWKVADIESYFDIDEGEVDEDDPESDSGKDDESAV